MVHDHLALFLLAHSLHKHLKGSRGELALRTDEPGKETWGKPYRGRAAVLVAVCEELVEDHAEAPDV